jgi:hypothetical protein
MKKEEEENKQNSGPPKLLHWSHSLCLDLNIALHSMKQINTGPKFEDKLLFPDYTKKIYRCCYKQEETCYHPHKYGYTYAYIPWQLVGTFSSDQNGKTYPHVWMTAVIKYTNIYRQGFVFYLI